MNLPILNQKLISPVHQHLNVLRFLVIKSQEENRTMADLSPFVIKKCIQSIVGHPKTI